MDPNPARLLKRGVPGCDPGDGQLVTLPAGVKCESTKMTPEYCAQMCWAGLQTTAEASGATILVGPEAGGQCFCDTVPEWDDTKVNAEKLVPSTKCDSPCTGGKTPLSAALTPPGCCGGQWVIDVYEMNCGSAWCELASSFAACCACNQSCTSEPGARVVWRVVFCLCRQGPDVRNHPGCHVGTVTRPNNLCQHALSSAASISRAGHFNPVL